MKKKARRGKSTAGSLRAEMAATKKDEAVAELYLEGRSSSQIAERLGRDVRTVRRSVQRVRLQWRQTNVETYEQARAETIANARLISRMAADAYRRSCETEHTIERITETADGAVTTRETKRKQAGDPRFLSLMERCVYLQAQANGVLDRDRRQDSATTEQKSALIEVVINSREELHQLQSMTFRELTGVAVDRAGGKLLDYS